MHYAINFLEEIGLFSIQEWSPDFITQLVGKLDEKHFYSNSLKAICTSGEDI